MASAAPYESIMEVRKHFFDEAAQTEQTLINILTDVEALHTQVIKEAKKFSQTQHLSHRVGQDLTSIPKPIQKLQRIRQSIYANAELVNYFKSEIISQLQELHNDAKALYSQMWTEIVGSDYTIKFLQTNADKEREASYILNSCNHKLDRIKTLTATTKQQIEFISDNLEQLNKTESALRLEYNMTSNVWDVGDTKDDTLGNQEAQPLIQQGFDPLVDTQDVEDI